jgi:MFS family permease
MLKAGLIGAGVGFVLAIIAAVLTPFCNPCVALLLGLGVGVLAAVWERPATPGASAGEGAKAGGIASVGSLVGQMIGAVANGLIVGPSGAAELYRQLDIQVPVQFTEQSYWAYNLCGNCLCGVVNVALAAGLGALGGILWYQVSGKNQPPASPLQNTL